jgi:hypothetical protein
MTSIDEGSIDGVSFEIYDLSGFEMQGFAPGFYYTAGDNDEENPTQAVILEGPFATSELAIAAAQKFIFDALQEHTDEDCNPNGD